MSESLYSDIEELQDSGRESFSNAPEAVGGADNFRRDFSDASRSRERGAFGRAPETQRDGIAELPPIDPDHIAATIAENLDLRERVDAAEWQAQDANEERYDVAAYLGTYDSSAEYAAVADELLMAGGGPRLEHLVGEWFEQDPDAAIEWTKARELQALQAQAAADSQAVDAVQGEHEAALSAALADFQQRYGIETDSPAFKVVAASLASLPNAANVLSSPEALTAALEQAYEHTADATVAFAKSVDEQNFRQAFRQESLRHGSMRPRTDDHLAQMAARRIGPSTVEDQALEIIRRAKGTNEDRRAAVAARNDEFRGAFAEASRSKFAEGNRAGAARAIKARDEGSDRRAGAF